MLAQKLRSKAQTSKTERGTTMAIKLSYDKTLRANAAKLGPNGMGYKVTDDAVKLGTLRGKGAVDDSGNPTSKPKKVDVDYVIEGGQNLTRAINRAPVKTYT